MKIFEFSNLPSQQKRFRDLDKLNSVKFASGDLVFGSSQFLLLPLLPQIMRLDLKVFNKSDSNNHLDSLI